MRLRVLTCGTGACCVNLCSIGSLGKVYEEEGVENVTVRGVVFTGTQNGLRIKSWGRPSRAFVRGVAFEHALMRDVENPIIIDQNYCPHDIGCPNQVSDNVTSPPSTPCGLFDRSMGPILIRPWPT